MDPLATPEAQETVLTIAAQRIAADMWRRGRPTQGLEDDEDFLNRFSVWADQQSFLAWEHCEGLIVGMFRRAVVAEFHRLLLREPLST